MSLHRILAIMKKSLSLRNPYLFFALLGPFFYAVIFQALFGLWKLKPEVVVYEPGEKAMVRELKKSEAIELTEVDSADKVRQTVEDKKVDIGLIFPEDTKELIAKGAKLSLKAYVNGESLAKSRVIVFATVVNALREVSPESPLITFKQIRLGEEKALTLMELLLPFFVIMIIILGSYMLPAALIVNEKEKKTLTALLVSPANPVEILVAFGLVGIMISLLMGMIVLLLTVGISQPVLLLTIFVLGSVLGAEWGLTLGLLTKDSTSLVANIKSLNLLIMAPAIVMLFPSWPQWIAKIFPTYYIANPVFRISIYGEGWNEIGWQILVLAGFCVVFFFPMLFFAKRLEKVS